MAKLTNLHGPHIVCLSIRSDSINRIRQPVGWRRQGALTRKSRCAGEQSPERENLHGTFRRLMKVGGFLFSWCVTRNINQKKEKPKVKTLIALALFAASIVGALAQTHVNGYYRTDGTYVQPHWRNAHQITRSTTTGPLVAT